MIENKVGSQDLTKQQGQIPMLISRQLKKLSTQTKSQALYNQVIQKNFQIIADLLKKLEIVFLSTFSLIARTLGVLNIIYQLQQKQIILYVSGVGKMEIDIETIHNQHRRNNFIISSNIEDLKFQINGIDNHVKMIYQDYRRKGVSSLVKSCKNLLSQSCISGVETSNKNEINLKVNKMGKIEESRQKQMKQPCLRYTEQNIIQKIEKQQQTIELNTRKVNKNSKKQLYQRKKKQLKKKSFRKSLDDKLQEKSETCLSNKSPQKRKSCFKQQISQSEGISSENKQEQNKRRINNDNGIIYWTKKGKKFSETTWNGYNYINLTKQYRNCVVANHISKKNVENRYKSQIKQLPKNIQYQPNPHQYVEIQTQIDNRQIVNNTETLLQNDESNQDNSINKIGVINQQNLKNTLRLQEKINQFNIRIEQLENKYNLILKNQQSYVTLNKYAQDMYDHFKQIKSFQAYSNQNFASKSETKRALLFINDRVRNLLHLNISNQPSAQNLCSQTTPNSTIISKCLGCNRLAGLTEETQKMYTISTVQALQDKKTNLNAIENKILAPNVDVTVNINDLRKRTVSFLKCNKRKKLSKYQRT